MTELFKKKTIINYEKRAQNYLNSLETPKKVEMVDTFKEIHKNIEDVNKELLRIFKKEEETLVNHYKTEMSEAQRNLKQLMDTMNEDELNRKFNEKKESLEKERGKFLEESLSFSSKCNELKDNLQQILIFSNDVEDELKFLDEQLVYADQHNAKLKSQVEKIKSEILGYDPNYKFLDDEDFWDVFPKGKFKNGSSLPLDSKLAITENNPAGSLAKKSNHGKFFKYQSPYSRKLYSEQETAPKTSSDLLKLEKALAQQKELNLKLKAFVVDPCFETSRTEALFNESVEKIKAKILERNTKKSVLPSILSGKLKTSQVSNTQADTSKFVKEDSRLSEMSTFIGEQELNDIDKRMIMEDFLSNEEVKRQIYDLLFRKNH